MEIMPEKYHDLLTDEKRAFVYLATTMADGSPQVTPVWFNTDGTYILINSARGRVKDHNMRTRPRVALCIADPADPYRYLQLRGRVVEVTHESAEEHINTLSLKYTGKPWQHQPGQKRMIYKILPEKTDAH